MRSTRCLALGLLLSATLTNMGCATTTLISGTDNPDLISKTLLCQQLMPIRYSRNDTVETQRQVIGDNAEEAALCGN